MMSENPCSPSVWFLPSMRDFLSTLKRGLSGEDEVLIRVYAPTGNATDPLKGGCNLKEIEKESR
jgi:hypothetical protein